MKFVLEFDMSNDAFQDVPATECARILGHVAGQVRHGILTSVSAPCPIHDSNGNRIGQWLIVED